MKYILFFASLLSSISLLAASYPAHYNCVAADEHRENIELTVWSADEFMINGVDKAGLDLSYKSGDSTSDYKKLRGFFESAGDGKSGYSVDLFVDKYIRAARSGSMEYRVSDSEESFSVSYRCDKLKK